MKTKLFFFISLFLITVSCSNDEDNVPAPVADPLEATGLLGVWEFQGRTINGEDTGAEPCCIFIEMEVNVNTNDLQGTYLIYGAVPQEEGIFIVNTTDSTVEFSEGGADNVYGFNVNGGTLTLTRTKGQSLEVETYVKRN